MAFSATAQDVRRHARPEQPGGFGWHLHRDRPHHSRHIDHRRSDGAARVAASVRRFRMPSGTCRSIFSNCISRLSATALGNRIVDLNNAVPYSYLGKPIVISQKLPSTSPTGQLAIYYGDLQKAAAFGDRRAVTIKRSTERYFELDQVGLMGTERIDTNVHDAGTASTAGPIVALKMG